MTRTVLIPAGTTLLLMLAMLADSPVVRGASDSPTTKTAAQEFKNIQVLKDIPADQLIPTMQFIGASLGVECDFCHAGRDKDKDDKEAKKKAREMMRMTFAINQNSFSGKREVTCNTCHQGSTHPQAVPAITADAGRSALVEHDQDHDDAASASWQSLQTSESPSYTHRMATVSRVTTETLAGSSFRADPRGRCRPRSNMQPSSKQCCPST